MQVALSTVLLPKQCPLRHRCVLQPTRIPSSDGCASAKAVFSSISSDQNRKSKGGALPPTPEEAWVSAPKTHEILKRRSIGERAVQEVEKPGSVGVPLPTSVKQGALTLVSRVRTHPPGLRQESSSNGMAGFCRAVVREERPRSAFSRSYGTAVLLNNQEFVRTGSG
jgi:hypothetical protein